MKEPEKCFPVPDIFLYPGHVDTCMRCKCPVERLINLLFLGYVDREKKKPLVFHFP